MKYFLNTEFIEGFHKPLFGKNRHFIDLISIGIYAADGREYYAISKEFDLKEAWNRYQLEKDETVGARIGCLPPNKKVYWLRDNVLKPIWKELEYWDYRCEPNEIKEEFYEIIDRHKSEQEKIDFYVKEMLPVSFANEFSLNRMRELLNKHGKRNTEIAAEVTDFIYNFNFTSGNYTDTAIDTNIYYVTPIEIYGYFADYDWVLFCSLFGRMIDLPKKFPMYCRDLKQILDIKAKNLVVANSSLIGRDLTKCLEYIKKLPAYPKQTNEHNALSDAKWNYELYNFLKKI